jgi:hypothetical protein
MSYFNVKNFYAKNQNLSFENEKRKLYKRMNEREPPTHRKESKKIHIGDIFFPLLYEKFSLKLNARLSEN